MAEPVPAGFDATPWGMFVNYLTAVPEETARTLKEVGQSIARFPVEAVQSLNQAMTAITDWTSGKHETLQALEPVPTAGLSWLLGDDPIKGYSTQVAELEDSIKNSSWAKQHGFDKVALPLAFGTVVGGESLNFLGGEGQTPAAKRAVDFLVKETDPKKIFEFLIHNGIDEKIADDVAPHFANSIDRTEVENTLRAIEGVQTTLDKNAPIRGRAQETARQLAEETQQKFPEVPTKIAADMEKKAKVYTEAGIPDDVAKLFVRFDEEATQGAYKLTPEAEAIVAKNTVEKRLEGKHDYSAAFEESKGGKDVIETSKVAGEGDMLHEKIHAYLANGGSFDAPAFQRAFDAAKAENPKLQLIDDILSTDTNSYGASSAKDLIEERYAYLAEISGGDVKAMPPQLRSFYDGVLPPEAAKIELQPTLLNKQLPDYFETKTRPTSLPKITEAPAGSTPEQAIKHYTQALKSVYGKFGKAAEEALFYTKARYLELSEAGYRYQTGLGMDAETHGVSSTFPDWIPENLRSMKLFEKVLKPIESLSTLTYPARADATKQRALMDQVLSDIDGDLGIDTSGLRARINESYEGVSTRGTAKTAAAESVRSGAAGGEGSGSARVAISEGTPAFVREKSAAQDAAAAAAGPRKIVDRIPLPPSVGDILAKEGKVVPIEQAPVHTIDAIAKGRDGKSWQSLVRGFMYNHTPKKRVHILDYFATPEFVLEKVGLARGAEMLQLAKDKAANTIRKEFDTVTSWIERAKGQAKDGQVHTDGDTATLIFDWLDGQEKEVTPFMTETEIAIAREIRAYLKQWADRLGLPEENRIGKYITHIFERSTEGKESQFLDPELAAIMAENVAKSVYDPFLQKRLGKQDYIHDVWRALDAYIKRASRKEAMDPALEEIARMAEKLDGETYNYVKALSHRVNMRPTEIENAMDSFITQTPIGHYFTDRPTAFLSRKVRQMFYRGTLGLNIGSAMRNLTQGANTYAKLKEKYTIIGYSKLFGRMATRDLQELYDQNILSDALVQDRHIGAVKKAMDMVDSTLFSAFSFAETINRGAAYFGAKSKALAEGLSEEEAITFAKRMVRETQFAFGAVDTPVWLNDDVVKTLTQLQTYNIKQTEFLGRMAKQKDMAGLIRWTAASFAMLYSIGRLFGMTANQIIPTIGLGGAPLTSTAIALGGAMSSDEQTQAKAVSQLKRNFMAMIPGGAQIRKTLQGASDLERGFDATKTGRFRYRVGPEDAFQALVFGPSSLPQAREYFDNLGEKKTATGGGGGDGNPFN